MHRLVARPIRTLATLGALALSLAACGLKGSLDLPPAAEPPPRAQVDGQSAAPPSEGEATRTATPARKRVFLDWLLD
ncbi:MAG: LPS translocon maturation chaperone LptM [Xanthobacteraceae bacterium]